MGIAGLVVWAIHGRDTVRTMAEPPEQVATPAHHRDVLTGRILTAEGRPQSPASGWGSQDQPIRIRVVPSNDHATVVAALDDLLAFLHARTGYRFQGATLRSYGLVVEELVQGHADVAFLTAASYARARFASANDTPDDDVEAILTAVKAADPAWPGSDLAYRGAIIVRTDSTLHTLDDLDETRTVAMGHRTSGASSILPSALLQQRGLSPRIQRFDGYPVIVSAVLQGAVDAGCIWWSPPTADFPRYDGRMTVVQSNPDVFDQTRIIAFTQWLPNEPVAVRAALPVALKAELARAVVLYAADKAATPQGRAELMRQFGVVGYIPATDDDYRPLMEIIDAAFAGDAEGRHDFMTH